MPLSGASAHLVKVLTPTRTVVAEPNGRHAYLVSSLPLVNRAGALPWKPISLALRSTATGFAPVNPLVPVTIARNVAGGVSLPGGITIRPTAPLAQAGTRVGDRVFFANVAPDTDFAVAPIEPGAETSWYLRSPRSPSSLSLSIGLPEGASLRMDPAFQGAAEIVRFNSPTVFIPPPSARDAQGTDVPASYAVHGNTLSVIVPHASRDVAYPIAVDPPFYVQAAYGATPTTTGGSFPGWSPTTSGGNYFTFPTPNATVGLSVVTNGGAAGASGYWAISAPGTADIQRADFTGVYHNDVANAENTSIVVGFLQAPRYNYEGWAANAVTGPVVAGAFADQYAIDSIGNPQPITLCAAVSGVTDQQPQGLCGTQGGPQSNTLVAGLLINSAYSNATPAQATVLGLTLQEFDPAAPDSVALVGLPSGWVNAPPTTGVITAHQPGLGVGSVSVYTKPASGPETLLPASVQQVPCYSYTTTTNQYGNPVNSSPNQSIEPCPQSFTSGAVNLSGLPDGITSIVAHAQNVLGVDAEQSAAPEQVNIDRVPPVFGTLTGSLATAVTANQPLTTPVYSLTVPATDALSGVQSITAAINCPGVTLPAATQSNPADGAPLTDQVTLDTLGCTRGDHTITLTATDRAGNQATTAITFDVEPQAGDAGYFQYKSQQLDDRMALSENVGTGNLALTATDISIAGTAGMNLDVTRTYNALGYPNLKTQPLYDAQDLSPGWRLSIGPDVHLETTAATTNLPTGDVRYYDPTGGTYVFTPTGTAGQFYDANGLPAHLTQNTSNGTYKLSFYLDGSSYSFASPASSTAPAPLASETDPNGNSIIVNYVPGTCGTAVGCEISTIQGTQGQTLTFTYNGAGKLSQIQDTSGRKWQYNYDANGNLNLYTDPTGAQTTYQYNPTTDLLTGVTDPNGNTPGATSGHTTTIVYTANPATNQVASVTEPDGTSNGQVTQFAYLPSETDVTSPNGYLQPGNYKMKYLLDSYGRVVETTDPDAFATTTAWTTTTGTTPSPAMTNSLASDPSTGATTKTAYYTTKDYRPTQTTEESGATNACTYPTTGANQYVPSTCTDDLHHTLTYTYDANSNLETTSGTVNGQTQTPVDLSYNPPNGALAGTVSQSVDGDGRLTVYHYNAIGQLVTTTPPAIPPPSTPLGNTTTTYDPAGRVHTTTDGAGRTTTYTYDGDDRVLTTGTTGGGSGTTTLTYTYDGNGNQTSLTDPTGETIYTHDPANRLVKELRPDGTAATYGYDEDDDLTSLNDGVSDIEAFTYDVADRLLGVTATTATGPEKWTYAYQYTPPSTAMQVTGETVTGPNGIIEQDTLTNGQLTAIKYTGTAGTLTSFNYDYALPAPSNVVSDLVQSRTTQTGATTTYGYDTFDRLTSAVAMLNGSQTSSYQYTYDGAGNRAIQTASGTATTYAYHPGNELASATPQGGTARTFTYDGAGDQLTDSSGESEVYNQLNQTTNFTGPTNLNPTYRGPGQGDRATVVSGLLAGSVSPTDSSLGTTSIKNTTLLGLGLGGNDNTTPGNTQVIRDPDGNLLGISITSSLLNLGLGGTTSNLTYATDDQGSVAAVYDPNQKAQDTYTYGPYGATTSTEAAPQPFRFQGQCQDATGLYHMGQRYYDPSTGEWLQGDPVRQLTDPSWNAYGFADGDPVNGEDPSGECSIVHCIVNAVKYVYRHSVLSGDDAFSFQQPNSLEDLLGEESTLYDALECVSLIAKQTAELVENIATFVDENAGDGAEAAAATTKELAKVRASQREVAGGAEGDGCSGISGDL